MKPDDQYEPNVYDYLYTLPVNKESGEPPRHLAVYMLRSQHLTSDQICIEVPHPYLALKLKGKDTTGKLDLTLKDIKRALGTAPLFKLPRIADILQKDFAEKADKAVIT